MSARKNPGPRTQWGGRIGKARRFMQVHAAKPPSLRRIAREVGASPYYFSRMFHALTGESPFEYLQRARLRVAVDLLLSDPRASVTDVALSVGYETPSAFNRAFKVALQVSPSALRRMPAIRRTRVLFTLEDPKRRHPMKLNLTPQPEIEQRKDRSYLYVRTHGPFSDQAPQAWSELHRLVAVADLMEQGCQFVGVCWDEAKDGAEKDARYDAGVIMEPTPAKVPAGLKVGTLPGGRYARFVYQGPYTHIGQAFDQALTQWVARSGAKLRQAPALEVYLNNPETTAAKDLKTALLIPIE